MSCAEMPPKNSKGKKKEEAAAPAKQAIKPLEEGKDEKREAPSKQDESQPPAAAAPAAAAAPVPPPEVVAGRPAGGEDQPQVLPAAGQPGEEKGDRRLSEPLGALRDLSGDEISGIRTTDGSRLRVTLPRARRGQDPEGGDQRDPRQE